MVTQILELTVLKVPEENPRHQVPKLTVVQQQEKLFEKLNLSSLETWVPKLAAAAWTLLAEYHNVFPLEPSELGCTHSTTHVIKFTDDTPFKE